MKARLLTLDSNNEVSAKATTLTEIFDEAFANNLAYGFTIKAGNGNETTYYFGDLRSIEEMADGFIEGGILNKAQAETFIEKCEDNNVSHYVRTRLANHKEVNENTVVVDHRTGSQTWPAPG
jgi:hypothetical protein